MTTPSQYTDGYRAKSEEALSVLKNPDHPKHNPECTACGVMGDIAHVLLEELSGRMTQNELFGLAMDQERINNQHKREPDPPSFYLDPDVADLRAPMCA